MIFERYTRGVGVGGSIVELDILYIMGLVMLGVWNTYMDGVEFHTST